MTPEEKARQQIDAMLAASGWIVQSKDNLNLSASLGVAVCELSFKTGEPDYTLFVDGKAIGTVEAKPAGATLTGVEEQSAKYVTGVPFGIAAWKSPLPFCYESTGQETYFTNRLDPDPRSRSVFAFHRPETLLAWVQQEKPTSQRLREFPPLPAANLWPAQIRLWPAGTLCITIAANIAETGILTYPSCFPDSVVGFHQGGPSVIARYIEVFFSHRKGEVGTIRTSDRAKEYQSRCFGEGGDSVSPACRANADSRGSGASAECGGGVGVSRVCQPPACHPPPPIHSPKSLHWRACRIAMTKPSLTHRPETKTVTDIINLFEDGLLNLEPGFQRQSVWSERDRAKLIDSILRNYPLPAVFFYRREEQGQIFYDVIDGKQRIESILMFTGEMRGKYWLKTQLPGHDETEWIDWARLCKRKIQHLITGYRIPVIEVDGDIGDIIDVFVRINSTGKALTPQEKRHAKYYNSGFLREADRLARRNEQFFLAMGILGAGQISRMKHVELLCELMLSAHQGDVINRKSALDRVMATNSFSDAQTQKASGKATIALNRVKRMFPKLKTSRLRQMTDFYSLTVLISKFESEGLILTDRRRNQLAWDLLAAFSDNVDKVRENQRRAIGIKPDQEIYRDYLLTVSQMSDDVNQRRKRETILRGIIGSLFAKKDAQRGFTLEQRRILWNTSAQRKCVSCSRVLSWDDFTIDHIDPHSKGGRSRLENAALMCRSCNSAKGNRRRK